MTPPRQKPQPPAVVVVAITNEDKPYLSRLSPAFKGVATRVYTGGASTLTELTAPLKKAGVRHIVTSRLDLLLKLLPPTQGRSKPSIDNYAGSIIPFDGIEFLIIHPLKQLRTVPFGYFLAARYISKIVAPHRWRQESSFDWKVVDSPEIYAEAKNWLERSTIIGVDIETVRKNAAIRCIGFCGLDLATNTSQTYVFPIDSMQAVYWMRELCWLQIPKVFQNGKYDINYLLRYGCPVWGYMYDTVNMLHCWYSELPKDLASVSALLVRNSMYWKDLADTNDTMEYYKYNALDCWATAESAIAWLLEAPDWALANYKHKFPQVAPAIMCELRGIKRDPEALALAAAEAEKKQSALLTSLQTAVGKPGFNPSSPVQVKKLLHVLGYKKAESSDEKTLVEAATTHPLIGWFVDKILEYREERKLSSTYLKTGEDASEFKGRVLFALNPHGTDTGRYASKQHHFWCGLQVQNIPAGPSVKGTLVADPGFEIWEADYSQAEDRGVAYKSGDKNLLDIFNRGVDSHSYKAAMFFGLQYEEIYDEESGKVLRKDIRQLGKRINHGANYNMGARVLLETMGSKAVREAARLLGLPSNISPLDVCKHLLFAYERAFPTVKTRYYAHIKKQVKTTNKLVGDTGWTRYCFGDPTESKVALNAYVAHVTQSMNAMILDKAFMAVFKTLAFDPDFKLLAQIHDSILFQLRKGRDDLALKVKELMTFPVPVTDCAGVERTLVVPVDLTKKGQTWHGDD